MFEFIDFGLGEEEAAGLLGFKCGLVFELAGEKAVVVTVAEDVVDGSFDVVGLGAAIQEVVAGECFGVDDLEEEVGCCFFGLVFGDTFGA